MDALGIDSADIGLPGAGEEVATDVRRLAREISDEHLGIAANCAGRTMRLDIDPIAEASQAAGIPIEACLFIGSSPIRQYAEDWTVDDMLRHTEDAVSYAVSLGVSVMFVTEDTTRAMPADLQRLYKLAIDCGARRICLCDTVGHATPEGAYNLVAWARSMVADLDVTVKVDWHGHNDRGLGVANCLSAAQAGADRLHGTALGIGERVGNASMDQILINARLLGWLHRDLSPLGRYCDLTSEMTGIEIQPAYPVMGRDAFRTSTGVHASAIIKAMKKGDDWLANRVYSGVPADYFGRRQIVELGPMSGQSNVVHWLESHGIVPEQSLVNHLFTRCKASVAVLSEDEVQGIVMDVQRMPGPDVASVEQV